MSGGKHIFFLFFIAAVAVVVAFEIKAAQGEGLFQPGRATDAVATAEAPSAAPRIDPDFLASPSSTPATPPEPLPKPADAAASPAYPAPAEDTVTADAYLVGDLATGKIYLQKDPDAVMPIASMSKLVTAIVATDTMSPTTTVEVTEPETEVYPDPSNLQAGEKFSMKELLYPLLLDSSNVAAEALASSTDRAHFLNLMNGYAWEIGMSHSYFGDPSGLSPHNQASASDFFKLARYVYSSRPDLFQITRIPSVSVATTSDHGAHAFDSIHPFVRDPRFIGGKTGHTDEAGDTMLTVLRLHGRPIAVIVLHSLTGERAHDTELLADKADALLAAGQ
ncbi:MAG: D-alanyl-D-alanine carboxypeptidase [Patescibacteria group bacterium]|nr:D-alanyl-D-alanine carboxypeptidase [Patescibacteria group bacterium]